MAITIQHPNLTATATTTGLKAGVPGGVSTVPGGSTSIPGTPKFNTLPDSPLTDLSTRFRPPSLTKLTNIAQQPKADPEQDSRDLDVAVLRSYENSYRLETMVACTQHGTVTVTGGVIGIPSGLSFVEHVTGSVDSGSTPHNFTVSITPSQINGSVDIHVFQPKATNDVTPVAATVPVKVRWTAVGGFSDKPLQTRPGATTQAPLQLTTGLTGFTVNGS